MAKYVVDCIMNLFQTRVVDLVSDWDDPSKTDWLRENVEFETYREYDPEWDTTEKFIG